MSRLSTDETKIIYHIDDEETPYLVKVPVPHSDITLADFKAALSLPRLNYKYFFKSLDDDFGVVKEEIIDENTILPIFKGRVVAWLVAADGSNLSDNTSQQACSDRHSDRPNVHHYHRTPEHNPCRCGDTSSVVTSDIETTSFVDSDDDSDNDINSHTSTTTDETSVSRLNSRRHRRRRRRHRMPIMSRVIISKMF